MTYARRPPHVTTPEMQAVLDATVLPFAYFVVDIDGFIRVGNGVTPGGVQAQVAPDLGSTAPGKGAGLIGVEGGGRLDAVLANMIPNAKNLPFGAKGDALTNDTAAIQAAINFSAAAGINYLYIPSGRYILSPATPLDVSKYTATGAVSLTTCLLVPAGFEIMTAGLATEFVVQNATATTVAIAVDEDPATTSQKETRIGRFKLRAQNAHGLYGILTPSKAGLLANKRPRYSFDVFFAPTTDNQTISTYGWTAGLMLGDFVDAVVRYSGYGSYNTTIADAGQHQMTGLKVMAFGGAYGLDCRFNCSNMRTFWDGGDGLEGFHLHGSEGQGCWEGVVLSNSGGEPGGFVDAVHVNANKNGYSFKNRQSLQIGKIEAYRSDGYHDHGGEWNGVLLDGCGRVTCESLHVNQGTLHTKAGTSGWRSNNSTFISNNYHFTFLANAVYLNGSPDCMVGRGVTNAVDVLYNLNGADTNDFTVGDNTNRAGTITSYFITDGTVDKKRLRFPLNSLITVRTAQEITISAAGTTTVKPRETATKYSITMSAGAGAFTYDLILDRTAAIPGDTVQVKIIGTASANPTLRICDHSTATILSSFNTLGATRLVCEYILNEAGNWIERGIYTSLEGAY